MVEHPDFVVFSPWDWELAGHRYPVHFLIAELAKQLCGKSKFFWVNRPLDPVVTAIKHARKLSTWVTDCISEAYVRKVTRCLYVCTPMLALHDQIAPWIPFAVPINRTLLSVQLRNVLSKLSFRHDRLVAWLPDPGFVDYIGVVGEKCLVYHCGDDYIAMAQRGGLRGRWLEIGEKRVLKQASIVFTTSKEVADRQRELNPNTHFLANAVEADHFKRALDDLPLPHDIAEIRQPIIGFVGTMNQNIDFRLLAFIATQRPYWSIVLIGPFYGCLKHFLNSPELADAKVCPNVHLLGPRPYENLPGYLKAFDVCMVSYKNNEFNAHRSPVKLYEYMATGKPIVSTENSQLRSFEGVIRIAATYDDYIVQIEEALKESVEFTEERLRTAAQNTWEVRAKAVRELIETYLE